MKKFALLALAAVSLTGCWTLILSEATTPTPVEPPKTYTTTVTTPTPKVTTVTTFVVTDYNTDPCFFLDLNAVAGAYAEARSVREFEQILNSSRYMINNLDLNRDGWIDYLRVIETYRGFYHALLIQACLAPGVIQDVATVVAERRPDALFVEVIGDRYLYGTNYIVRPVFIQRPPMWDVYGRPNYAAWSSPYYYGYYPSYYTQPKPVYLNHYQAYVTTYMSNHHYCHHCDFPSQPHYNGYTDMTRSYSRNDYSTAHPDNSFERRVTRSASNAGVTVRNAAQLRSEVEKSDAGTTRSTSTTTTSGSSRTSGTTSTTSTTRSSGSSSTSHQPNTTSVQTRVNTSGTTRTTVKTTDSTGRTETVKRESSSRTTSSSGSTTRSSQGTRSESTPRSGQRGR